MVVARLNDETQQRMRDFFHSLNEKDRRRYAGLEASRLGHGGISYIRQILGCDRKTVAKGIAELSDPPDLEPGRIRKKGGTPVLSLHARRSPGELPRSAPPPYGG